MEKNLWLVAPKAINSIIERKKNPPLHRKMSKEKILISSKTLRFPHKITLFLKLSVQCVQYV